MLQQAAGSVPALSTSSIAVGERTKSSSARRYAPRSPWDNKEYQGKDLQASARLVVRATKPTRYALFGNGSIYNQLNDRGFDGYDAFHNDAAALEKIVADMAPIEVA